MIARSERIAAEIAHGRRLSSHPPEVWAWSTPAGVRRARRRAELLAARGGFHAGQRVLEIGCGIGSFTGPVARTSGADVFAADLSGDLLAIARRRRPGIVFVRGDAHALPFADGSFDGVFGSSTLHHLELDLALTEIRRVLRAGGRLVFAEPNLVNPQVFVQKRVPWIKRRLHDTPHETAFVRGALARRVRAAGFARVSVEPFDFLHPLTPESWIATVAALGRVCERLPLVRELAGSCLLVAERSAEPAASGGGSGRNESHSA